MARTSKQLAAAKSRQAANTAKKSGSSSKSSSSSKANKLDTSNFADKSLTSQMDALNTTISGLQAPSADETGVSTQLANLTSSSALGQAAAQDPTKNPVSMNFQTGQAKAIQDQANAQSVPLSQRLALLQAQRQSSLDVDKSNMSYLQSKYTAEQSDFEKQQALKNQLAIANVNAQAKTTTAAISAAKKKTGTTTKLQKAVKYNSDGNQVTGTFNPVTGQYSWDN